MLWAASLLALMAGSAAITKVDDLEDISHEEMAVNLASCDFTAVAISYQDYLQSDVVAVADQSATDEQLDCLIRETRKTGYIVEISEPLARRYYELLDGITRPELAAEFEAWFAERPDLGILPEREADETDDQFAGRLEAFCGPRAKGAFAREYGVLTISSQWLQNLWRDQGMDSDAFGCLYYGSFLAGLPIRFVGNEKPAN